MPIPPYLFFKKCTIEINIIYICASLFGEIILHKFHEIYDFFHAFRTYSFTANTV